MSEERARLQSLVKGRVLGPGEQEYEASRRVFNAMIDRRPGLILRCAAPSDAVHGVNFARERGLDLSMKGGGHSVAGNAVCDGGLMLDMSGLSAIEVDRERRVAVAQAGMTLGQFDAATAADGLATTLGVVSLTGIAGLTLGGGIGWLNGKHGLACDNVESMDVVTADGRLLTVNAEQHDDLYWALRGGGGNFGVVTSFTYRLHPVRTVLAGVIGYPAELARESLVRYHELARSAPDELSTAGSVWRAPSGEPMVSIVVCWSGPAEEGERVLRPLREIGTPVMDTVGVVPYPQWQSTPDAGYPNGRQHYWKAAFLPDLSDAVIDTLLAFAADIPSPYSGIGLQQMTGAAARVDAAATAFAHRARHYDCLVLSQWDDPADSDRNIAWTRSLFDALGPHLREGVYVNNLGDEGGDRIRAAYGANYDRLCAVKATYDPGNLFRLNQNIRPAT